MTRLADRIFTDSELQSYIGCSMSVAPTFNHEPWSGTLEQGLDWAKQNSKMDYWQYLWLCMQPFLPAECRKVGLDCILRATEKMEKIKDEVFVKASNEFHRIADGSMDAKDMENLYRELCDLMAPRRRNGQNDPVSLVCGSAMALYAKDANKSCPMILLKLRKIVGSDVIEDIVRHALRNHP